jgi:hypothetical protein
MNKQIHMMHMRYLVYRDAIIKAIRVAHREMVEYADALAENERRRRRP